MSHITIYLFFRQSGDNPASIGLPKKKIVCPVIMQSPGLSCASAAAVAVAEIIKQMKYLSLWQLAEVEVKSDYQTFLWNYLPCFYLSEAVLLRHGFPPRMVSLIYLVAVMQISYI